MSVPSHDLASQFSQNLIKVLTYIQQPDVRLPSSLPLPIFTTEEFSILPGEDAPFIPSQSVRSSCLISDSTVPSLTVGMSEL